MRALVQRVQRASVTVEGEVVGSIGAGLCVLVGVTHTDDVATADRLATKVWNLRCFDDDDGAMNRSVAEAGGSVLVVSQFTLYGDTRKGRRPSYVEAARPEHAEHSVLAIDRRGGGRDHHDLRFLPAGEPQEHIPESTHRAAPDDEQRAPGRSGTRDRAVLRRR